MTELEKYNYVSFIKNCLPTALIILSVQFLSIGVLSTFGPGDESNSLVEFIVDTSPVDSNSMGNVAHMLIIVIVETFIILLIIKLKLWVIVKGFIFLSIFSNTVLITESILLMFNLSDPVIADYIIAFCGVLMVCLWVYPEWYIVNIVGIGICASVVAIIGGILSINVIIVLMLAFAIYDLVAVFLSKHMLKLAECALDLKLPLMFIIPHSLKYSYVFDNPTSEDHNGCGFMGFGDAIFPTLLVVGAYVSGGLYLAVGTITGTMLGVVALVYWMTKHEGGLPALPALCSCTILGYFVTLLIQTVVC